jgi:Helix-turn-helix domain
MREAVRSGRRTNFFMTENRFIDHYAAKVGGSGVAVYSILQRCANSETKETWISAGKMADVLAMDKSTVYRYLNKLEDLRLIKSMRTREKTIYVVLPVPPPRAEAGSTPLFDAVDFKTADQERTWPTVAPEGMSPTGEIDSCECSASVASMQQTFSSAQTDRGTDENRNKEEQDELNNTQEQDLFNKTIKIINPEIQESAKRVVAILRLPEICYRAALAAVEIQAEGTDLSMDGVVQQICTDANHAQRRGVSRDEFLADFLARKLAGRILDAIHLPPTNSTIVTVTAALKAEAKDRQIGLEQTAALITSAAIDDRRRGVEINRFYFENCKWRSNAGVSKAERRKLDNLEVNARVKQRLRERLGAS